MADTALCMPAQEVVAGLLSAGEADLGSGLFKKRLARPGGGKRGGLRAIVAYRSPRSDRVLIAYIFAKNAASTLSKQGHEALRRIGSAFGIAGDESVGKLLSAGDVMEVACDAENKT